MPLVESQVRRSPRLKELNKGFKSSTCLSRKCFTCNPCPPDLSLSQIKQLGSDICKISEVDLDDSTLLKKNHGSNPGKENKKPDQQKNKSKKRLMNRLRILKPPLISRNRWSYLP